MSPTILLLVLAVLPPPRTPEALVERALRAAGMKRPDQPVAIYCHYQLRSKDGPAGSLQIWINATADTWLVVRRPEKEESIGNPVETVCYGVLHENRRLSLILRAEDAKRRTEAFFRPFGRQEALIWLAPLLHSKQPMDLVEERGGQTVLRLLSPRWPLLHLRFDSAHRLLQSTATGPTTHTTLTLRDHRKIGVAPIDAERLTRAGIALDNDALLRFLTEQAPARVPEDDIRQAIDDLGAASFRTREEAKARLRKFGRLAIPALLRASKEERSLESVRRIEILLRECDEVRRTVRSAARALAARPDRRALPFLVHYLASEVEADKESSVAAALDHLALAEDRVDPRLIALSKGEGAAGAVARAALARLAEGPARPGRELFLALEAPHSVDRIALFGADTVVVSYRLIDARFYNAHPAWVFSEPAKTMAEWR